MSPPLDPASHLHMLCQYTIYVYSLKDLLGPGGERSFILNFILKNDNDPISVILTGNKFALKHVSLMHMCNNTKTKAGLFQQYILCLVSLQKFAAKTIGNQVFLFSKHQWCKKM